MLSSAWCVFGASCSLKQNFMFQQWWHVCSPLALRGCPICGEGVYKVCVTTGLWATLVCAVVGPSASRGEERNVKNSEQCPLQPLLCLSCCIFRSLKFLIFSQFFHSRWASILPSLFRSIFQTITIWQMQRSSASRVSESNRKGKIDAELKLALTLPKAEKLSRSITNSYLMVSFSSCAFHHCILDMNDNRIIIVMLLLLRSNKNDDLHITSIWFS